MNIVSSIIILLPLSLSALVLSTTGKTIRKLVIVGGGIGGISSAYDAIKLMPDQVDITVISDKEHFYFTPSNPWVATGFRKPEDIRVSLTNILPQHGIHFVQSKASVLHPEMNELELENGNTIGYDYLILATGPRLAYETVPGADLSSGFLHSICTTRHAQEAKVAIDDLVKKPGPIVIGALQGASCFGPAYEFAFLLEHELRKRGGQTLVDECPMTFVTSEPYIGHLGLKGAGDSADYLQKLFKKRNIRPITNCKVTKITKDKVSIVYFTDELGTQAKEEVIPSKFNMFIPPFHGLDVWRKVDKLTNDKGMILINDYQQSLAYPNIFGVGVCVNLPPVEKTLVPTGSPKTGYMIESMGTAAVHNIKSMIEYEDGISSTAPVLVKATLSALCIGDLGDSGSVFLLKPQMPPRTHELSMHGKFAKLAKIAFEKYFLYKVESGDTDPYYEKYMLELLGLKRTSG